MNVPGHAIPTRATAPSTVHTSTSSASVTSRDGASRSRQATCDLYTDCCRQVLGGGMSVHALVMPDIKGRSLIMNEDEDLRDAVEKITGNIVNKGDLVVLLGSELLDDPSVIEAQMLVFAIADIAMHIDNLYSVADRTTGWLGKHIGTAAVAAALAGAHPTLRALRPEGAAMETVKTMASQNMGKGMSVRHDRADNRQADLQINPTMALIDSVCEEAMETHGGYMTLPAAPQDIAAAAKMLLLDAMDAQPTVPRPIL